MSISIPSLEDMLKAGVHLGHKKSKRHPKMEPFIFSTRNEISIIDVRKTQESLKEALEYVTGLVARGGTIMFIGTKRQGQQLVKQYALECGAPYVNARWLGGTLTNFEVISKMIKKYHSIKTRQESGELLKYTKKEQLEFSRELQELEDSIGGMTEMHKLPEAVFILDLKKDKTAYQESRKKGLTIVAACDTNVNSDFVDYVIPANDDAVKSITMMLSLMSKAVQEGKKQRAAAPAPTPVAAKSEEKPAEATATPEAKEEKPKKAAAPRAKKEV